MASIFPLVFLPSLIFGLVVGCYLVLRMSSGSSRNISQCSRSFYLLRWTQVCESERTFLHGLAPCGPYPTVLLHILAAPASPRQVLRRLLQNRRFCFLRQTTCLLPTVDLGQDFLASFPGRVDIFLVLVRKPSLFSSLGYW